MRRYRSIVILVLIIIGLFTLWRFDDRIEDDVRDAQLPVNAPSFISEGFVLVEFDQDGRPEQRLEGERLIRYPRFYPELPSNLPEPPPQLGLSDAAQPLDHIQQPRLWLYSADQPAWQGRAEAGWRSGETAPMLLHGDVHLHQPAADTSPASHMETDWLWYEPRRREAHTEAAVNLTRGFDRQQAIGLHAWLERRQVDLLSDTRGTYEIR